MKYLSYILLLSVTMILSACKQNRYVQITGMAQSVEYSVKINVKDVSVPVEELRDSVDAILQRVDFTLSGYNKQSLLARFNAGETIRPNDMFIEMYNLAYCFWKRSGGALDFAAAPLYDAWGFGFKNSSLPTDSQVKEILSSCGMSLLPSELPISPDGTLDPSAMGNPELNYNAIAQGYTCDVIARYLYGIGVKDMLVDIGEIWCDGLNPASRPWSVAIDRPVDRDGSEGNVQLKDIWSSEGKPSGITTSGNYRKFFIKDGKKFSHTINPVTGYPVEHNLLSATVVCSSSAADSDAFATWCMVIGLEKSQELISGDPFIEGYLVYSDADGEMKEWSSPGFQLKN